MKTRKKILKTANDLFNQKGLNGVTVRELARTLNISPGNLSYHFKTKANLVAALLQELHASNTAAGGQLSGEANITQVYQTLRQMCRNNYTYRGLMASYTEAVLSHKETGELESELYQKRLAAVRQTLRHLVTSRILRPEALADIEQLAWLIVFLGRNWMSDARLHCPDMPPEELIDRYALRVLYLLAGYLTPLGRKDFDEIVEHHSAKYDPDRASAD